MEKKESVEREKMREIDRESRKKAAVSSDQYLTRFTFKTALKVRQRERERETDRQTDRQTETERQRDTSLRSMLRM